MRTSQIKCGPLSVQKAGPSRLYYVVTESDNTFATTFTEANARLIAAAPDLLDACKQAIRRIEHLNASGPDLPDPTLDKLNAAIAKAEA